MATRSDTTTGTITLTAGSTTFTTVGVNLITRGHLPGDEIYHPATGLTLKIETITGENAGTLRYNCPAACAGAGQPVDIRFQPDGSRVKAESRNLIDILASGNNVAEAAIDGTGGNWLSYYTGVGTKARTAFPLFARTLLAGTSGAAMYGILGGIPNAQLPERLGATSKAIPSNNYNLAIENGFYNGGGAGAVNGPPGSVAPYSGLLVFTSTVTPSFISQLTIFGYSVGTVAYMRGSNTGGSTWSAWVAVHVEYGSNANGSYVRLPDGTQICWHRNSSSSTTATADGAFFRSTAATIMTFPAAFSATPIVVPLADKIPGGSGLPWAVLAGSYPTTTQVGIFIISANATYFAYPAYIAVGRWY